MKISRVLKRDFVQTLFRSLAAGLMLVALLQRVHAQSGTSTSDISAAVPVAKGESVTVTAESLPFAANSASVTVLTQERISASHAENAADLLREVPFLYLSQQGGEGGLATLTIRGAKPNLLLVMIDGVPVNDLGNLLGGAFDFSSLSLNNIEQIEIVRGPLSSVYGSEAVAGVINIITRSREDGSAPSSWKFDGSLGNFASREFSVSGAGELGLIDYSIGGSVSAVGEQVGNDSASLNTVSLNSTLPLGQKRFVHFTTRYADKLSNGYPTGGGGPEYSILRFAENDRSGDLVLGTSLQSQANERWFYKIGADFFRRTARSYTPAVLDRIPPTFQSLPQTLAHTDFHRFRIEDSNNFALSKLFTARLAVRYREEAGVNQTLIASKFPARFDLVRSAVDVNGEMLYHSDRFTGSVGLGINRTEGFSGEISPRVGGKLRIAKQTHLRGSWGTAFSVPSIYALGQPQVGNPLLKPERSNAYEMGIEQVFAGRFKGSATYFEDHFRNLIDFSAADFKLVNRTSATMRGVELEAGLPFHEFEFSGYASYLHPHLEGTTEPLRNQPHGQGGIGVGWRPNKRFYARVDTAIVGRRYDFQLPVPEIQSVAGYATSSIVARWEVRSDLLLHVRLDNAWNQAYHEFIGFPNPGVRVRAGVSWRLPRHPA